jgi:glycosyltransferase involved in cell wall biosynthesis
MNKVLIVTYYWPPAGGAGVQRWLKFSKYLPQSGWEPIILTVNPSYATYPAIDPTLDRDLPASLKVYKTKSTDWFRLYKKDKSKIPSGGFANNIDRSVKGLLSRFIRGNFFIPDPRRGWNRHAVKEAVSIILKERISAVITTSPPHSSQLIGLKLKKIFPGIQWIADLRDSWTDIYYYELFYPTFISKMIDRHYEKSVLKNADKIITVGHNLAENFKLKIQGIERKMHLLSNGYDEEDFTGIKYEFPSRFIINYTGTLSEAYPVDSLLSALNTIKNSGKDFLLQFVGYVPEVIKEKILKNLGTDKTEFIPYTEHKKAINYMCRSSMLLLIIPENRNNRTITPGKVFEYIAAQKPVLYIGPPDGDAAYHLSKSRPDGLFETKDIDGIVKYVSLEMSRSGKIIPDPHPEYSRKILSQKLGSILCNNHQPIISSRG